MSPTAVLRAVPLACLGLAGCTSATERFEQGLELQAQGRYTEAAYRYADALEGDPSLSYARTGLVETGDSVVRRTLRAGAGAGPVEQADGYREIDRLRARAAEVDVRVPVPSDHRERRRAAFDAAIAQLFAEAAERVAEERFADARAAYRRARVDYEPDAAQREESLASEAGLLLRWADLEARAGRHRAAYEHAGEALELPPHGETGTERRARRIRSRALDMGTVRLAVLPVTSTAPVREAVGGDFALRLSDDLELDHWSAPPPFVAVADPARVRRAARTAAPRGRNVTLEQLRRLLDAVGADFGALVEVGEVEIAETDVERETRRTRRRDGQPDAYQVLSGVWRYGARVDVEVADALGGRVRDFDVQRSARGDFERGVYRGDPTELDLGRNEAWLFAPERQAEAQDAIEAELLAGLAEEVARRTFEAVLARVR